MSRRKRKKYTREFKEEAVRLLEQDPRSGDDIALALGIDRGMLYRWRRQLGLKPAPVESVSEVLSADEKEELRRLRKEVAQLRMEK
jgi:transposase